MVDVCMIRHPEPCRRMRLISIDGLELSACFDVAQHAPFVSHNEQY